jgi:hypothetical protein
VIVFCNNRAMVKMCHGHAMCIISEIRNMCPPDSVIVPMVLTIYDFTKNYSMRLCNRPVA